MQVPGPWRHGPGVRRVIGRPRPRAWPNVPLSSQWMSSPVDGIGDVVD